jgi:hypothetical protein
LQYCKRTPKQMKKIRKNKDFPLNPLPQIICLNNPEDYLDNLEHRIKSHLHQKKNRNL